MKVLLLAVIVLLAASCSNVNLFSKASNKKGGHEEFMALDRTYESKIKPDDKLSISIWDHDNISIGSAYSIYNTNEAFGKWILVEKDGTVKIPQLGELNLGGFTLSSAEDTLTQLFSKTIKNPIIEIKILNAEISVLGELNSPGTYKLEKEINTLVEVISRAEGLTSYAKKKKIQIIRDNVAYTVDLTKMSNYQEANIILRSGDVLYVPAVKSKALHERAPTIIPFATLLTSVAVLISVLLN